MKILSLTTERDVRDCVSGSMVAVSDCVILDAAPDVKLGVLSVRARTAACEGGVVDLESDSLLPIELFMGRVYEPSGI